MVNFKSREAVTLEEVTPFWWGKERYDKGR